MTPRHLRRVARANFGMGLREWLDQARLEAAPGLLKEQGSCKVVAALLGFKQESHFSRKFKEWHGVSPGEVIKQSRAGG